MGNRARRAWWRMAIALAACVGLPSCSLEEAPDDQVPTWEEFRDQAERVFEGNTFYVVEWDIGLTLEELRAYYLENVAARRGRASQRSTVNRVGNQAVEPGRRLLVLPVRRGLRGPHPGHRPE